MSNTSDKKRKRRLARQKRQQKSRQHHAARADAAAVRVEETLQLVTQLLNEGQGQKAVEVAGGLTREQPESWQAWNLLGTIQDHILQVEEAEESFRKVTQLNPDRYEAWRSLAKLLSNRGEVEEAKKCLQEATKTGSHSAPVYAEMARTLLIAQKTDEAAVQIEKAVELAPEDPDVLNILGLVRQQQGQIEEAALAFCHAAERRQNFVDAIANLGECLRHLGQPDQAEAMLAKVLELDPKHKNALGMMGMLKAEQGFKEESIPYLKAALELNPRYKLFRLQLARNQCTLGHFDESFENLDILSNQMPDAVEPLMEKAGVHAILADVESTRAVCKRVLEMEPDHVGAIIRSALALPQICESNQQIDECRQRLEETVDQLLARPELETMDRPLEDFPHAIFYLTYHGKNNRVVNKKLSQLYRRLFPKANYVAPSMPDLKRLQQPGSKIRLGFVSKNFANHTIGRLTLGLLAKLDRNRFEVNAYTFPQREDDFRKRFIESTDHFEILPPDPDDASQVLTAQQPDILFYPDIGMDPITYHMAHHRISPIQCVTWGHPVTTGISTMDYYMSNEDMDSAESQEHYTEKLEVLKHPFFYYERPGLLSEQVSKELLGLPEDFRLYLCPQTLFKFHPEFDQMLAGILRKDPKSLILLVKLGHEAWRQKLLARFAKSMPDVHKRIVWLPRMSAFKFMHLFRLGDVVLDPYRFGSGNSSLEALAMGAPFVTCPDQHLRTRATSAYFKRMGVMDCVAETPEEYVDKAVYIATHPEYRADLCKRIMEGADVLFQNEAAVTELENWFEAAVERHLQYPNFIKPTS